MADINTKELFHNIGKCESVSEFKTIYSNLLKQRDKWTKTIATIIEKNNYSLSDFSKLCDVSRQAVGKWVNGSIPKSRESFIKIGLAANYSLDEMNHFLNKIGLFPGLYPRSLEDSIIIFLLTTPSIDSTYENYQKLYRLIIDHIHDDKEYDSVSTSQVLSALVKTDNIADLLEFVESNSGLYKDTYKKLYAYIQMYIKLNFIDESDNIDLLAGSQQWSAALRKCVSEINQKKWYPSRNKIISLGIHLNMDLDQINYMLSLGYMSELYAKNNFESAIIFALESANVEGLINCDGTDTLCLFVRRILEDLDYEDVHFFLDELPKESDDIF